LISSLLTQLGFTFQQGKLATLEFLAASPKKLPQDILSKQIRNELAQYANNPRHKFNIPLHLNGTEFQKKVWRALQTIPTGKTLTYGELAKKLQTSPRAIGQACRTNPIPVIIPCHRIVAANHLGGYAGKQSGKMMKIKTCLLEHEKSAATANRA
jgi:methylated-DNA-[protein]-cysteine S-methyltransferase